MNLRKLSGILVAIPLFFAISAHAQEAIPGIGIVDRVAPGEALPLSIALRNFGSNARADVTVYYEIVNALGEPEVQIEETVAVETTAQFIKPIPIPLDTTPGTYRAVVRITYPDQQVPAVAAYQFSVEKKYLGFFLNDIGFFAILSVLAVLILTPLLVLLGRTQQTRRFAFHDYSHVPKGTRVYFEIISDAVRQMRLREGDDAIEVAQSIEGLTINANGKIEALSQGPSTVLANLVAAYEKKFSSRLHLMFRPKSKRHDTLVSPATGARAKV